MNWMAFTQLTDPKQKQKQILKICITASGKLWALEW